MDTYKALRADADTIIEKSLKAVLPDEAVRRALNSCVLGEGKVYVAAIGKAAWQMAKTTAEILGDRIADGVVATKYGHVKAEIPHIRCMEGGHPVPDENSFHASAEILDMVSDLQPEDTVLFLISGGGSTLFEKPLISGEELADITRQLLACGADITEMNKIRKHLSAVKGGKFALRCMPAKVIGIVLSDVLGDSLDVIASGPAYPDSSTSADAKAIVEKYDLKLSEEAMSCLMIETPKELTNVETYITGSVKNLCSAAADICAELGYRPIVLTDVLNCEAREAGTFLAAIGKSNCNSGEKLAYIAGGETVVHLTGNGKGGRNQEVALSAAEGIAGLENVAVFSLGSDGTDGPTDAAGGYCDGSTKEALQEQGIDIYQTLKNNDAYHALKACGGLIMTGATGTNVNDVSICLIR